MSDHHWPPLSRPCLSLPPTSLIPAANPSPMAAVQLMPRVSVLSPQAAGVRGNPCGGWLSGVCPASVRPAREGGQGSLVHQPDPPSNTQPYHHKHTHWYPSQTPTCHPTAHTPPSHPHHTHPSLLAPNDHLPTYQSPISVHFCNMISPWLLVIWPDARVKEHHTHWQKYSTGKKLIPPVCCPSSHLLIQSPWCMPARLCAVIHSGTDPVQFQQQQLSIFLSWRWWVLLLSGPPGCTALHPWLTSPLPAAACHQPR